VNNQQSFGRSGGQSSGRGGRRFDGNRGPRRSYGGGHAPRAEDNGVFRGGDDFGGQSRGPSQSSASGHGQSYGGPRRSFGGQGGGYSGGGHSSGRVQTHPGSYRQGGQQFRGRGGFGGGRGKRGGQTIDVERIIREERERQVHAGPVQVVKIEHAFIDFPFLPRIQENIATLGYKNPSPIQDRAIPAALQGSDVIGLADTGTGKTAAFLLPLIDKVLRKPGERVLVIAPTRELAVQIEEELQKFASGTHARGAVCIGGAPMGKQIRQLREVPTFVIGTPGRLKDLRDQRVLKFSDFRNVVLDEVDRMLDMGFIAPIRAIMRETPGDRQTLLFSATMPPEIRALAAEFLRNPITIEIASNRASSQVEQEVIRVDHAKKFEALCELLRRPEMAKVLVFNETKHGAEKLAKNLQHEGFAADAIHGGRSQPQRQRALNAFKAGPVKILVATDVAARGIDVKNISHVVNYTLPRTREDYVHRVGRTGRGGETGKAYSFV
jgi:ATP-dependent RNA helicase RhlE